MKKKLTNEQKEKIAKDIYHFMLELHTKALTSKIYWENVYTRITWKMDNLK